MRNKPVFTLLLILGLLVSGCAPATAVDELAGTHWNLQTIDGTEIALLSEGEMSFDFNGQVTGAGGCNTFSGSYEADASTGTISFSNIAATKMACGDGANMQIETEYLAALASAQSYELQGNTLTITANTGVLTFQRVM